MEQSPIGLCAQLDGDCRVAALLAMANEHSQPRDRDQTAIWSRSLRACSGL
jgi:hypothetical protein